MARSDGTIFGRGREGIAVLLLFLAASGGCQRENPVAQMERAANPQARPADDDVEIPPKELLITEKAFIRVAKRATPSVVNISSLHLSKSPAISGEGGLREFFGDLFGSTPSGRFRQKSLGSGFIISGDGLILTNNHVISDADRISVLLSDRREYVGQIVGKDPKTDLAVIRIRPGEVLPAVRMGDSERLEVGEWAIAIGNPFGLDHTVTVGVISATGRTNLGLTDYENFIQTDASINFGNSGGPLLNAKGEVVGINTAIVASGQGIGFAIPINAAQEVIERLVSREPVAAGWLGIRIGEIIPKDNAARSRREKSAQGVRVEEVIERGPGDRSGIRKGDLILFLLNDPVQGVSDFKKKVSRFRPGEAVELTVNRQEAQIRLQVILGDTPSDSTPLSISP